MAESEYDILVIGQGAAAFSAGLYAARYQVKTIVVGQTFGGETATGGLIENYPGHVEVQGFDLMLSMKEQVQKYDVPVVDAEVTTLERRDDCFTARDDEGEEYVAKSVVLAMGRERRTLGLDREQQWIGQGVSYCSTCDAPLYRRRTAAVVGGGDAAVKGASLVAQYADRVYVIYRGEDFVRPEPVNLSKMREQANIVPVTGTNVVELRGGDYLESIVLDREVDGSTELKVDGLLIEIGANPNIALARQLGINTNDKDEIVVDKYMGTNVPGAFGAGDITDASGELKQAITAAAQGALAATTAYEYVTEHTGGCCAMHGMGFGVRAGA